MATLKGEVKKRKARGEAKPKAVSEHAAAAEPKAKAPRKTGDTAGADDDDSEADDEIGVGAKGGAGDAEDDGNFVPQKRMSVIHPPL